MTRKKNRNQAAPSSSDSTPATSSSADPNNTPPPPEPVAALIIIGKTGVGKSSFIKLLGGKDIHSGEDPIVDGGTNSCTSKPTLYTTVIDHKPVILIDTPGFDDSIREHVGPLRDIVSLLLSLAMRPTEFQLHGVIFLHDISEARMSGSQRKTLSILEYMCGEDNMGSVLVGTTMWASPASAEFNKQVLREESIRDEYWGDMLGTTRLFEGDADAAVKAASDILRMPPTVLQVQKEMQQPPYAIEGTTVGRIIIPGVKEEVAELRREVAELRRMQEELALSAKRELKKGKLEQQIKETEQELNELGEPKTEQSLWEWFGELSFAQKIAVVLINPILQAPATVAAAVTSRRKKKKRK